MKKRRVPKMIKEKLCECCKTNKVRDVGYVGVKAKYCTNCGRHIHKIQTDKIKEIIRLKNERNKI